MIVFLFFFMKYFVKLIHVIFAFHHRCAFHAIFNSAFTAIARVYLHDGTSWPACSNIIPTTSSSVFYLDICRQVYCAISAAVASELGRTNQPGGRVPRGRVSVGTVDTSTVHK